MTKSKISAYDKFRVSASKLYKLTKSVKIETLGTELFQRITALEEYCEFDSKKVEMLLRKSKPQFSRKIVAREAGYPDWDTLEKELRPQQRAEASEETELYRMSLSELNVNTWFASYDEAKTYQKNHKNCFLLTYKKHFFIADALHIVDLGIDPQDPDWEKIGRDWAKPIDSEAKERLQKKLREVKPA